jgi:hypothetical protein
LALTALFISRRLFQISRPTTRVDHGAQQQEFRT